MSRDRSTLPLRFRRTSSPNGSPSASAGPLMRTHVFASPLLATSTGPFPDSSSKGSLANVVTRGAPLRRGWTRVILPLPDSAMRTPRPPSASIPRGLVRPSTRTPPGSGFAAAGAATASATTRLAAARPTRVLRATDSSLVVVSPQYKHPGLGRKPLEGLGLFEDDVLRALPQHGPAELGQPLAALLDRREVVPRELAHLAREARGAVGKEDLHLGEAARVEEELAGGRIAVRVLGPEAQLELEAHRHPGGFPAPACLHELAREGEEPAQHGDRQRRRLLLEARGETEASGGDGEHGGTLPTPFADQRRGAEGRH